jgi:LPXTG-motif cell wall-anchored protein
MKRRNRTNSSCRNIAAIAAVLTVLMSGLPAAHAASGSGPPARPRSLAVSVPSDAAPLAPGASGTIPIRVVNPGSTPVTVRVTGRRIQFADEGRVTIAGRDPMWEGRVDFPARPITVAAQSYRDVGLTVHMPAHISPDLYFVGFLVTPLPDAAGNITYINQVGSYITIDVPGPRTRTLTADFHVPGFAFTSHHVHATLHVHNVGKAAAMYWGENDTTATPGSSAPRQARLERSLLPTGRSRTIVVDAKPSFLVAFVTMHVHIFYPGRTDAGTTEIVLTKRVLVVHPAALVILGIILIGAGIWYRRRRRKRRRQRPTRPNQRPPVESAPRTSPKRRSPSRRQRVPATADTAARVDQLLARARANPKTD